MNEKYAQLLHLPHHVSETRAQMPVYDRAAQFAPFAALVGYETAVAETARCTAARRELDDSEKVVLNEQLRLLAAHLPDKPQAEITYFLPDERKSGGAYVTVSGCVKKIDTMQRELLLADGLHIPIDDMIRLESRLFTLP